MGIKLTSIIFTIIFFSCNNSTEKIKPVTENITESVYAAGIIKTKNQYQVFSTVSGIINKIFVTENDLVRSGSPLMLVSDETSKINRENAGLVAGYADLNANKEKLTDLKNSITHAQSKYRNDSLIFKRQQNLWNQNIGSRLELEQKELLDKLKKLLLG